MVPLLRLKVNAFQLGLQQWMRDQIRHQRKQMMSQLQIPVALKKVKMILTQMRNQKKKMNQKITMMQKKQKTLMMINNLHRST